MGDYIGIDLHKTKSFVTRMTAQEHILEQVNLLHTTGALHQYLTALPADAHLAVEATGNWMWLCAQVEDRQLDLVLAHPLKVRAIASGRIKTDKIDATTLAHLLRTDLLPTAYIPPRAIRDQRELLRYRASLVRLRTQVKNKIAAILTKTGVQSRRFLATVSVRACYRLALDGYLRQLAHLTTEIHGADEVIGEHVTADTQAQLLYTIPGIGTYSALLIRSEIGDIHRFPDSRHLCSYADLVPSVHASADTTRVGWLTKQGSSWLRWILVEVSVPAINGAPQFRSLYYRVAKKHGHNVGRVAVARALLKTIYAMLTMQQPFRPIRRGPPVSA